MKRLSVTLVLVLALGAVALVYAGRTGSARAGHGHPGPPHRFGEQLTREQREAIHDRVTEMREAGAPREEIHGAVRGMLEGYGIEPPEHGPEHPGPHGRLGGLLTEEQRKALDYTVTEMREAGASRREIHEAVRATLKGWGIEPPGRGEGPPGPHGKLGELLNEEQREAIHKRVMEMREAGASHEEIREAVRVMLDRYGIEPPQTCDTGADATTLSSENEAPTTWGHIKGGFR